MSEKETVQSIGQLVVDAVTSEDSAPVGLGTLLADRFRGVGIEKEIPELRGYPVVPIEFDP